MTGGHPPMVLPSAPTWSRDLKRTRPPEGYHRMVCRVVYLRRCPRCPLSCASHCVNYPDRVCPRCPCLTLESRGE